MVNMKAVAKQGFPHQSSSMEDERLLSGSSSERSSSAEVSEIGDDSGASLRGEDESGSEYDPDEAVAVIAVPPTASQVSQGLSSSKNLRRPVPAKLDLSGRAVEPSSLKARGSANTRFISSPTDVASTSSGRPSKSNSTLSINVNGMTVSNSSGSSSQLVKRAEAPPKRWSKASSFRNGSFVQQGSSSTRLRTTRTDSTLTTSSAFVDDDDEYLPGQWATQRRNEDATTPSSRKGDVVVASDEDDDDNDTNLGKLVAWSFPSARLGKHEANHSGDSEFLPATTAMSPGQLGIRKMRWKEAVQLAQARERDLPLQTKEVNVGNSLVSPPAIDQSGMTEVPAMSAKDALLGGLMSTQATAEVLSDFKAESFASLEDFEAAKCELKRLTDRLVDKKARLRTLRRIRDAAGKLVKSEQRKEPVSAPFSANGPSRSTTMTRTNSPVSPVDSIPVSSNLSILSTSTRSTSHLTPATNGGIANRAPTGAQLHSRTSSVITLSDFGSAGAAGFGSVEAATEQVDKTVEEVFVLEAQINALKLRLREHVGRILLHQIHALERKGRLRRSVPNERLSQREIGKAGQKRPRTAGEEESQDLNSRDLSILQDQLEAMRVELQKSQNACNEAQIQNERTKKALEMKDSALRHIKDTHAKDRESLESALNDAKAARIDLKSSIAKLETDAAKQPRSLTPLTQERDALGGDQSTLRSQLERSRKELDTFGASNASEDNMAASAVFKYNELELAVSAERRMMAERDALFHAFEARLERAEDTLRNLDRRCAALLGKSEGREELDDILAKVRGGKKTEKKTAGQDIDELLRSLEQHVEDLADELVRKGYPRRHDIGCNDDETSYDENVTSHGAEPSESWSAHSPLSDRRIANTASSAVIGNGASAKGYKLEELLEQSRREVAQLRAQVEGDHMQIETLNANIGRPDGKSRALSARFKKETVEMLEAQIAELRRENEDLRSSVSKVKGAKDKDGSTASTAPSDSSLVKVAGSHQGLSSNSDSSEDDEPLGACNRIRKPKKYSFVCSADTQELLSGLTEMLPFELDNQCWKKIGPSMGREQSGTPEIRALSSALAEANDENSYSIVQGSPIPTSTQKKTSLLDAHTALARVRNLREAARMAAQQVLDGDEQARQLRQRITELEKGFDPKSQLRLSAKVGERTLAKTQQALGQRLRSDYAASATGQKVVQNSLSSKGPTARRAISRGCSLSRLRPTNDSTPSFLITQPLSEDRKRPDSVVLESLDNPTLPVSKSTALSEMDLSHGSDGDEGPQGFNLSKCVLPPPVPRRSISTGTLNGSQIHLAKAQASTFTTAAATPVSMPIRPRTAIDASSTVGSTSLQRSITLGLSITQLVSRIRHLESELQVISSSRRAALEQVTLLEELVKEVEKQTEERMKAEEVEARAKMLEQMNDMREGLSSHSTLGLTNVLPSDTSLSGKALPLAPTAANVTSSPKSFALSLPFVGRSANKSTRALPLTHAGTVDVKQAYA